MYQVDKIQYLLIGVQGENEATNIEIDMTPWVEDFPDADCYILFKPYNSANPAVPALTVYDKVTKKLTWTVTSSVTQVVGVGYTEIRAIDGEMIKKSRVIPTSVENSVTGGVQVNPPAVYEDWVTRVLNASTDALNSAAAAMAFSQGRQIKFEIADDDDPTGMSGHLLFYFKDSDDEDWEEYIDLGPVDAYGLAVMKGYTGTKAEWATEIANASINAQTASTKAAEAQEWATGGSSGTPSATNNAEYYSEQAAGSATSAAASAATASDKYNVNLLAPNFVQENAYPAGQHVIYDGGYYVLPNGHEADTTWENTSNIQLTVGGEVGDLKSALINELINANAFDILAFTNHESKTNHDVAFTWDSDNHSCAVSGTASGGNALRNMFYSANSLPKGLIPGGIYKVKYNAENVYFEVCSYKNGVFDKTVVSTLVDTAFTMPSDATGAEIRLRVNNGQTVDEVVSPVLLTNIQTNEELMSIFGILDKNLYTMIGRFPVSWEMGGMEYSTGIEYISAEKIRTDFIKVTPGEYIYIENIPVSGTLYQFATNTPSSSGVNEKLSVTDLTAGNTIAGIRNDANYIRIQLSASSVETGSVLIVRRRDCDLLTESPYFKTLPNNSDLHDISSVDNGYYYLSKDNTYIHCPKLFDNALFYHHINSAKARAVQLIYTLGHEIYFNSWEAPSTWTAWERINKVTSSSKSGKFIELHNTARIKQIIGNTGNVIASNKNLLHLVPASASSNGIEWTEKTDGTISFHGTSTAKASFNLLNRNTQTLPMYDVFYTVSSGRFGDKYGSTDIGYALYVSEYDEEDTWLRQVQDIGEGVTFYAVPGRKYAIDVKIESGITVSDLRFAFQIELGEKRTGFVKHQGDTYAIANAVDILLYDGINVLYSANTDSDITVSYTDIERAEPNVKDELLFSISDPAQGTETEDPGVVFNRIKDTAIENSYKLLCDYRSYDTSNMAVFTEEFGFGVRQDSTGNNRSFMSSSISSTMGNYICVPVFVENLDNLDIVRFAIADTSSKYAVFDIKDDLHEGINWFVTNLYFANVTSGFNKNSIASVSVRTQAKENRAGAVTWGVINTYDFRPMCTYIFDDGRDTQYSYNYQKMKEYGFRAVYAVPTKFLFDGGQYHMTAEQAKIMAADGCDIISHTRDHVNLIGLTMAQQKYQIQKAREMLIQTVPGRNAYYFAPPNVNMTNNTRYHERAIAVMNKNATVIKRNDDKFTLLPNLNPLLTYCWGTNNEEYPVVHPNRVFTPAQMKTKIDIAIEYGLWVQFGMHYFVDNVSQFYDRDGWLKSDFEDVLDYLADHSADIDVVTYRQAYDRM